MPAITQTLMRALGRKVVETAVKGQHIEERAIAVQKIGRMIRDVSLSDADREFAEKILTLICRDVSDVVRRALSVTLQNSPNLPHGIAQRLIADIDSVAAPILINSPVITDDDLVAVLRSKAAEKVKAIAQRARLSAHISQAIVSYGDSAAVAKLAANDSAIISPETAEDMAQIYANDDLIVEAALSRQDMPANVVQKLINAATRKIENKLGETGELSLFEVASITNRTQQRALISYIDHDWPEATLQRYVENLKERGELTEDLILRAAGVGDIRFVQIGLGLLTAISTAKVGLMMFDRGPLGLKALCDRAGLSFHASHFLQAAIVIYLDFQMSAQILTTSKMQKMMLERILTLPIDLSPEMEADFCDKLDSLSHLEAV